VKAKFGTWSKDGETRTPETKDLVNWLIADGWKQDPESDDDEVEDVASASDAAPGGVGDAEETPADEQPPAPEPRKF
jgi:hypothetical protein